VLTDQRLINQRLAAGNQTPSTTRRSDPIRRADRTPQAGRPVWPLWRRAGKQAASTKCPHVADERDTLAIWTETAGAPGGFEFLR
jgi:hypothetical protein